MVSRRRISAVVLAAGEGTRMRSSRPKPLHMLCGRPMLLHVLDALVEVPIDRVVVVVGHGAERVTKTLQEQAPPELVIEFVEQHSQRGTGDAASVALTAFPDDDSDDADILVLPGDAPLLQPSTVGSLVAEHRASDAAATVLTAVVDDPRGYGRVVRGKDDRVARIVEDADATYEEREIAEVNTSVYCFRRGLMAPALRRLDPDNAKGEYYLSDMVAVLSDTGHKVAAMISDDASETMGVNDRAQLALAERELRRRTNERWMRGGVTMLDPDRTCVDMTVELAPEVTLYPDVMLQGHTVVGARAHLGPNVRLVSCVIGEGAWVEQVTGHDAEVGANAIVGPFAVLEPGSYVPEGSTTGPFYTASGVADDA
jgi:bifunctional UDP-N-acetylglucosamine pyrophosphorylase/glucosamine-1-phosphate N-acetyltransferase